MVVGGHGFVGGYMVVRFGFRGGRPADTDATFLNLLWMRFWGVLDNA